MEGLYAIYVKPSKVLYVFILYPVLYIPIYFFYTLVYTEHIKLLHHAIYRNISDTQHQFNQYHIYLQIDRFCDRSISSWVLNDLIPRDVLCGESEMLTKCGIIKNMED